jgi:putative acetyltransferase
MNIRIRHYEKEDLEGFKTILEQPSCYRETLQQPYQSLAALEKRFQAAPNDYYSFVALIDDQVVGHSGIRIESNPRRKHAASIGMIVHEDFRKKGVGKALLETMIEMADNWLSLKRIELEVYTDNEAAVSLYKRFGFEIEGTAKAFAFRNGVYTDVYKMARITI